MRLLASRNVYILMNRNGRIQIGRIVSGLGIVLVFYAVQISVTQIC